MEISIKATPQEITALVFALQERRNDVVTLSGASAFGEYIHGAINSALGATATIRGSRQEAESKA